MNLLPIAAVIAVLVGGASHERPLPAGSQEVIDATLITQIVAAHRYSVHIPVYEIVISYEMPAGFSLTEHAAVIDCDNRRLVYNAEIVASRYGYIFQSTIPHEVAHMVMCAKYGGVGQYPHGDEWRSIVLDLGGDPDLLGV